MLSSKASRHSFYGLISFVFFFLGGIVASTPAHADFSASLAQVDSSSLGSRTPLILVHGIHGKEDGAAYWQNFVNYFSSKSSLTSKYKLYKFEYDSDIIPVGTIGLNLANEINARQEFQYIDGFGRLIKKKIVILAHSMGGLVSRSYMQEHGGNERIIKLITLATPHHGSPGANDEDALEPIYTSESWDQIFTVSQFFYNSSSANDATKWVVTFYSTQPNRSDLRWDNLLAPHLSFDANGWLASLNSNLSSAIAQKIIAYYGYIDPQRWDRLLWEDTFQIIASIDLIPGFDPHTKLTVSSAVMDAGLSENFPLNDGMVPAQSGSLVGQSAVQRREFFDYDHLDMKDGRVVNGAFPLFSTIKSDLEDIYPGITFLPDYPHTLQEVTFDGAKAAGVATGPNVTYLWDFGDGATGTGQTPIHIYKQSGTKNVTLTISDDSGNYYEPFTVEVVVRPYPITVSYPNGFEDLYRGFSTPERDCSHHSSPCIENYSWNYGDGSPAENNRNGDHTYATSGYYTVTLTLTLDDNSTIQSQAGNFVGPGTRYIQGHTIYGSETWYSGGTYVVQGGITVAQGATLTIEPGAIVKMPSFTSININGTLKATGASGSKIVFTHITDDAYGGDTNGDGGTEHGGTYQDAGGNYHYNTWNNITFNSTSTNSIIDNVIVMFAGQRWSYDFAMPLQTPAIGINSSSVTVSNSEIKNNYSDGCNVGSSSPVIQNNTIANNGGAGITATSVGAATVIKDNIILNNGGGGIGISGSPTVTGNTIIGTGKSSGRHCISISGINSLPQISGNNMSNCGNAILVDNIVSTSGIGNNVTMGNQLNGIVFYGNWNNNNGTLTRNTTWNSNLVYIPTNGSYYIPAGITLTIEPGTIVKLGGGANSQINVSGTLVADGTADSNIVFTHITDDSYGGDTNGDGNATHPGVYDSGDIEQNNVWGYITFGSTSANSIINHAIIKSGGRTYMSHSWISVAPLSIGSSSVTVSNSEIKDNYWNSIQISGASPIITANTVSNDSGIGMDINGSPTITGNTLTGTANSSYGISIKGNPLISENNVSGFSYGIYCDGSSSIPVIHNNVIRTNSNYGLANNAYYRCPDIDATNNDWGDPSGPLDNSDDRATGGLYNPNGLGNKVSDKVNYYPWAGMSGNGATAVPTGLTGAAGSYNLNLKWNANSEPHLGGYKIYYGTTTGVYGTPKIVGNVTSYNLTGLSNNTPYFITIASMNSVGTESAKTSEITVTPIYDVTKPTSQITSPPNGAVLIGGGSYAISGTANDGSGTGVQKVEISINSGPWTVATGTTSWSYGWSVPSTNGSYTIRSRATDNAENVETPGAGVTVTSESRHTIFALVAGQGSITCDPNPVPHGGSSTCTITPDEGYEIHSVQVDGTPSGRITNYTFQNVTSNGHSISASFVSLCQWAVSIADNTISQTCVSDSPTLKQCLKEAQADGRHNTIMVGQGTHKGNFTYGALAGEDFYLILRGGYEPNTGCGNRVYDPDLTVLDGDTDSDSSGNGVVLDLMNQAAGNITVDGFLVKNGYNAVDDGGCVRIYTAQGQATVTGNIIHNCAAINGGGIGVETNTGDALIVNNIVHHNSATLSGGGMSAMTTAGNIVILNNTVADNEATDVTDGTGGGVAVSINSDAGTAEIINNIIRGNSVNATLAHTCEDVAIHSDIDGNGNHAVVTFLHNDANTTNGVCSTNGGFTLGPGNVDLDPQYVNQAAGDYHLQLTSPVIDAGVVYPDLLGVDIDGQARVSGTSVDMGADEVPAVPQPPIVSAITPTKDTTPTWTWVAGGGGNGTFRYRLDNPVLTTGATTTTLKSFTPATALANGNHTLYVQERNAAGLWSATGAKTVLIDTVLPVNGTVTATPGTGQIGLSWSGFTDALSGIGGYKVVFATGIAPASCSAGTPIYTGTGTSYTHTGLINATYGYRVCAIDNAGNVSTGATKSAKPLPTETAPPTGSILINSGADWTKSGSVTLTLTATDDSPPIQMCISNTTSCTAWTAFAATKTWTLTTGNGTKTVYAWFRDTWGNTTPTATPFTDTIGLDATLPINGTVTATPGAGQIALNWSGFTDALSGIGGYKVVFATGIAPASCSAGTPIYTGTDTTYNHTGLINLTYGYRVCAIDRAGNLSTGIAKSARPLPTETNPPAGSIVINSGADWTKSASVTLTLTATDDSPPIQMCISNTTSCTAWAAFAATKTWTLPLGNGTKTVRVWFKDTWGNTTPTATPYSDTIGLDATLPVNGIVTTTPGAGQIALNWSGFTDALSGMGGYKVVYATGSAPSSCSAGTVVPGYDGTSTSYTHTGLINATYGYRVCAIDNAGNTSTGITKSARPLPTETAPPAGSIVINSGADWTKSGSVTLTLTATDDSPPVQMCISNTTSCTAWTAFAATKTWPLPLGNGTKTVYARFRDTWGNATPALTPYTDTIGFDATLPANGTVTATPGAGQNSLSWSGFTDALSGIGSYKVVYSTPSSPTSCSTGTVIYSGGLNTTYTHTGLNSSLTYYYRVCAIDRAGNSSSGAIKSMKPN